MAITCQATGLWDQILDAPYLSKQQWQAANLLILCQIIVQQGGNPDMSSCEVSGLWEQIKGNPPFLSDQEFYAENINLLCQLAGGGGGGGGGGFGTGVLLNRAAPTGTFGVDEPVPGAVVGDAPFSSPTKITDLSFINGAANLRWQPDVAHAGGGYWIGYA